AFFSLLFMNHIKKSITTLSILSLASAGILFLSPAPAYAAQTIIAITSGTTWTVPSDWDATAADTIECIGPGGKGVTATANGASGGGGGGGAYAKISNLRLFAGQVVSIQIGATTTSASQTWFLSSSTVSAAAGANGAATAG